MLLQILAYRQRTFRKTTYTAIFFFVFTTVSSLSLVVHYEYNRIPAKYLSNIVLGSSVFLVLWMVLPFLLCIFVLFGCTGKSTTENDGDVRRRLFWTLPLFVFTPLATLEMFRATSPELVISIDRISAVFILLFSLLFLPAYRRSLCFCCSNSQSNSVQPMPNCEEKHDLAEKQKALPITNLTSQLPTEPRPILGTTHHLPMPHIGVQVPSISHQETPVPATAAMYPCIGDSYVTEPGNSQTAIYSYLQDTNPQRGGSRLEVVPFGSPNSFPNVETSCTTPNFVPPVAPPGWQIAYVMIPPQARQ